MKILNKFKFLLLFLVAAAGISSVSAQCNLTASFSYTDNGNGNYTFTDNSTGNYNSWLYLYGDGTAPSDNPTHSYNSNGVYQVCLLIEDTINLNCYDSTCFMINVTSVAPCNLVANYTVVDNGNGGAIFTNNSTGFYDISYYDYGDGTIGTSSNHTYPGNGIYQSCLILMDSLTSCYDSICHLAIITSSSNPCNLNAIATISNNGSGSYTVSNNSSGSYTNSYIDYGDGTVTTNSIHTYASNGVYTICLFVEDSASNCIDTACQVVTVTSASGCNIVAGFTITSNGNGNYLFTNTSTGGGNNSYFWDFGDGTTSTFSTVANAFTTGTYTVCLTVSDGQGCSDTYCDSVIVNFGNPSCNNVTNFTYTDNGNGNFSFNNTSTGTGTNYHWSFGDGTSQYATNPTHTFAADGTYGVILAVDNPDGSCYTCNIVFITVTGVNSNPPCNAGFTIFPDTINPGINFTVWNSSTGGTNYFWDFGDGATSTLANPMYTYTSDGPFYLCLTVSDSNGCSSTYCDSIGVGGFVFKQAGFTIGAQSTSSTVSIEEIDAISEISTYPNPLKDVMNIEINLTKRVEIEIFATDLLGKVVAQIANQEIAAGYSKLNWNADHLPNGVYFLNIQTNNSLRVEKFVVNK